MKYEITQEDKNIMIRDLANNRTLKHLKHVSFYKFTIGDILIRENKYGDEWKVQLAECGLPNKYVYVFENELGVGYIRRLSINGRKFVETPICVVEFDPSETRFVLDPEYADHILLAEENTEFDAKSRYDEIKRKREAIHRKNKKARVPISNLDEALAFMKTLNAGDQFWLSHSISYISKDPITVTSVEFKNGPSTMNSYYTGPGASKINYTTANGANHWSNYVTADSLIHYYVFLSRPIFLDEQIG